MKKRAILAGAAAIVLALAGCGRSDTTNAPQTAAPTVNQGSVSGNLTVWAMGAEAEKLTTNKVCRQVSLKIKNHAVAKASTRRQRQRN